MHSPRKGAAAATEQCKPPRRCNSSSPAAQGVRTAPAHGGGGGARDARGGRACGRARVHRRRGDRRKARNYFRGAMACRKVVLGQGWTPSVPPAWGRRAGVGGFLSFPFGRGLWPRCEFNLPKPGRWGSLCRGFTQIRSNHSSPSSNPLLHTLLKSHMHIIHHYLLRQVPACKEHVLVAETGGEWGKDYL